MRELNFAEVDMVAGASEWGDNVLKYAGAGALLGAFGGPKGTAAGIIVGAVVGTIVTLVDD